MPDHVAMTPLMQFKSKIAGKNADVALYPDRLEWSRTGHPAWLVILLAICTACISLIWVRPGRQRTEMMPIKAISSVTSKEEMLVTTVQVITSGNVVEVRADKSVAREFQARLTALVTA